MVKRILFGCLMLLAALPAQAEYFQIDNYRVLIRVDAEGIFHVKEVIDLTFSEDRHGIFREIPYRYKVDGKKHKIKIYNIRVEDWPLEKSWDFDQVTLKIGDPDRYVNGRQRYVISYKVKRAWLFPENQTEFYWNVIGVQWPVSILKAEYRISFEKPVDFQPDDYWVYTGAAGEQGKDATILVQDGVVYGQSTRELYPYEGLTVALRLPVDFVHRPSKIEVMLRDYGLLIIPLVLLTFLFSLWERHGRDEPVVTMAQYYPPADLPPAEVGGFYDDTINNRDLTALIPYWAGEGFLEIYETEEKILFIFTNEDYEFKKLKDLPRDRPSYERTIFDGLFESGDRVKLSSLKNKFYTTMTAARRELKEAVVARMLYTPESRLIYNVLPVAAIVVGAVGILLMFIDQTPAGLGMLLTCGISLLMRRPMLKKTKKGMEAYQHIKGFREFVDKADRPRLERLLQDDPSYFEKTLPFAIAFGMAAKWSAKFEDLFTTAPQWYHSYSGNSVYQSSFGSFAESFESSIQEIQSGFTSTPGGSGGGGSSGGGFGGGGGGSW